MKIKSAALSLIALFLGITFVFYGVVKVLGGQFQYQDFVLDSRTTDGPSLVWCFYGYSPIYGRLIGLAEMLPGVLLLLRRTRTLGALLLLPVVANITVMDFCFAFPEVKYFALLLTTLALVLLAADRHRLRLLVQVALADERRLQSVRLDREGGEHGSSPAAKAALTAPQAAGSRWVVRTRYGILAAVGLVVAAFLVNLLIAALTNPVEAAAAYCTERGWNRHDLVVLRWRLTSGWSGFNREGEVEFQVQGSSPSQEIRVTLRRPHSFTGWQVVGCTRNYRPAPERGAQPAAKLRRLAA